MRANTQTFSFTSWLRYRYFTLLVLLTFTSPLFAQDLPEKILGYKVYKANISVDSGSDLPGDGQGEAFVTITDPKLANVSLNGLTLSVSAAIKALNQSGKVDFLTFHDFQVNGIPVEIEKYDTPFSFRKDELVTLPKPATLFLEAKEF